MRILKAKLLIFLIVVCGASSCERRPYCEEIMHNDLCGVTDYLQFSTIDTGYIITHVGDFYDSAHISYVYQTVNGGTSWQLTDSLPSYSFREPFTTYKNNIYGYVHDGSQSNGYRNNYLCMIDLRNHNHEIHNEIIHGPGPIVCYGDTIIAYVFIDSAKYFLRLSHNLSSISIEKDTLHSCIKDVAYSDSLFAFLTYDNELYFFSPHRKGIYPMKQLAHGIQIIDNDCYIACWRTKGKDACVLRKSHESNICDTLSFPHGYHVIDFMKMASDSIIIITFARREIFYPFENIVYSTNRGLSWTEISLDPFIFPKNSCYCKPYLIYLAPNNTNMLVRWNLLKTQPSR